MRATKVWSDVKQEYVERVAGTGHFDKLRPPMLAILNGQVEFGSAK